jgi:hypothetical protein
MDQRELSEFSLLFGFRNRVVWGCKKKGTAEFTENWRREAQSLRLMYSSPDVKLGQVLWFFL